MATNSGIKWLRWIFVGCFFFVYFVLTVIWYELFYDEHSKAWIPVGLFFATPETILYRIGVNMLFSNSSDSDAGLGLLILLLSFVSVISMLIKASIASAFALLSVLLAQKLKASQTG